jgi:hypothetical protein
MKRYEYLELGNSTANSKLAQFIAGDVKEINQK